MKKFFMVVGLVALLASSALAGDGDMVAGKLAAEMLTSGIISTEESAVVTSSIQGLLDAGVSEGEAKNFLTQAVTNAKVKGLEGKGFEDEIGNVVQAYQKQQLGTDKVAEHPATNKPKDNPAHD